MNPNRVFWGLLVSLIGVLWLLGNLGVLNGGFWVEVWRLWPLLLVLWGVSLLIGKGSRASLVFSVISVVIVLAAILGFGWLYNNEKILHRGTEQTTISRDLDSGINAGEVDLKFGATELELDSGTEKFIEGGAQTFTGISVRHTNSDGRQKVVIDQVGTSPFFWGHGGRNSINLKLNETIPYRLNLDTGASKFNLDLSNVEVPTLNINGGATSGVIELGDKADVAEVQISSGASSFTIKVPDGAGLRIDNKSGLSSIDAVGFELQKDENIWQSGNYEVAVKKIRINFSAGASSIKIEKY